MSFQHRSSTQCVPMLLSLQTRKKYDKSPTFKIYTTSACILRSRNIFWTPRAERTTAGLMLLGLFLLHPPSGRGLVITFFSVVFYPAIRTGSSNTVFFSVVFFWWSLAPDLRFSLGQRNTRHVFRYTAKRFYLE